MLNDYNIAVCFNNSFIYLYILLHLLSQSGCNEIIVSLFSYHDP